LPSPLCPQVDAAIAANKTVVFGRSTCPFCIEVTRTLGELGVPYAYHRLDAAAGGAAVHDRLKATTGQRTVPYVFIGG
jgi:glutaredoxin